MPAAGAAGRRRGQLRRRRRWLGGVGPGKGCGGLRRAAAGCVARSICQKGLRPTIRAKGGWRPTILTQCARGT